MSRHPAWLLERPRGTECCVDVDMATRPSPDTRTVVAIPARDEADRIAACLAARARQVDRFGRPLRADAFEMLLLLNNCRDASASIARRFAERHRQARIHVVEVELPRQSAHVGWARRLAMNLACGRLLEIGRQGGVIATTDADSVVAPNWIAAIQDEVSRGAQAVGGRLLLSVTEWMSLPPGLRAIVRRQRRDEHRQRRSEALNAPARSDPYPSHFDHCGASLALTAALYLQCGGLPRHRARRNRSDPATLYRPSRASK